MNAQPLVLLVDDESVFIEIATVRLGADGLRTIATRDIRDAIEKAEALQPDLILCDVYMPPGPNGWDLALMLRRNPKTSHIKIALFTSLHDPWLELTKEEKERIINELGKVVLLSKMDDIETLAENIVHLLGKKETAGMAIP